MTGRHNISCDSNVEEFYNIVNDLIERFVLLKTSSRGDFPSWFIKKLKIDIKDEIDAHWKFKLSDKESDYIEFKRLRALCVYVRENLSC